MKNKGFLKITFEDHGQDFTEWYLQDGLVVDCRPFQATIWCGNQVLNETLDIGDKVKFNYKCESHQGEIRYPLVKVEKATKPWGWEIEVVFSNGRSQRFSKQGSVSKVKRWGMLKTLAKSVTLLSPYTREQWNRAFGHGDQRM